MIARRTPTSLTAGALLLLLGAAPAAADHATTYRADLQSLTTRGDTSADSALAVERFPWPMTTAR